MPLVSYVLMELVPDWVEVGRAVLGSWACPLPDWVEVGRALLGSWACPLRAPT